MNTDPNGGWVPIVIEDTEIKDIGNNKIEYHKKDILALQFEEGDDAESLAKMLGIEMDQAEELFNGGCFNITQGDKIIKGIRVPTEQASAMNQAFASSKEYSNDYNCWASAIYTSQGRFPLEDGDKYCDDYQYSRQFDERLEESDYENVSTEYGQWKFGKTIFKLREDDWQYNRETTHGCIFLGKSQDGTMYVFTKNGWNESGASIMKFSEVVEMYGWLYSGEKAYNFVE